MKARVVVISVLLLLALKSSRQQQHYSSGGSLNSKLSLEYPYGKSELVFLLDGSGSIGPRDFAVQLLFVKSLLTEYSIGGQATRVAIVSYSDDVTRHIDYIAGESGNKCSFLSAMEDVKYVNGSTTDIARALEEARHIFASSRPDVNKALILLSDGIHTGADPLALARELKADGVEIFTIGAGLVDEIQLQLIASSREHYFAYHSFSDFERLALRVRGEPQETMYDDSVNQTLCNSLCQQPFPDANYGCCDLDAKCTCSLVGGRHACVCGPGTYGRNGFLYQCKVCPRGTYKSTYEPTDGCTLCPPDSTTAAEGSNSLEACACKEGFEGNPFRDVPCRPRGHCVGLADPVNGSVQCQDSGTLCRFTCEDGYNPVGSRQRMCTETGEWSGENLRCRAITCPLLSSLRHGTVSPSSCTSKRQQFASVCTFSCHADFQLQGPQFKRCLSNGSWSQPSEIVECIDDVPPVISCPASVIKEADPGLSSTEVSWAIPTVYDNLDSRDALTVDIRPSGIRSPHRFEIGSVIIAYVVTDTAGLSSECMFEVVVQDTQPPMVESCPNATIDITSAQEMENVSWPEPVFADNSNQDLNIVQSHVRGAELTLGRHIVMYTATDSAGLSAICQFRIILSSFECPDHPAPHGGRRDCAERADSHVCRVHCNESYEFVEKPAMRYICDQGRWRTERPKGYPIPWPDCSERSSPVEAKMAMEVQYYAGACLTPSTQHAIKTAFIEDFQRRILGQNDTNSCHQENICRLDRVKLHCDAVDEDGRRRRQFRAIWKSGQEYTSITSIATLDFTMSARTRIQDKARHKSQFASAQQTLEEISGDYERLAQMGQLQLMVNNETLPVVEGSFSASQTFRLCREGSILVDKTECMNCAVGSYQDTRLQLCSVCEEGTYQDQEGQNHCKSCPGGMWTAGTQAKDVSDCWAICNPGTYSPSGLATCWPCPRGTYQPAFKQTSCLPCKEGTTTPAKGSKSSTDCQAVCTPGTFSATGLHPCQLCPLGSYQPEQQQRQCNQCTGSQTTTVEGVASADRCRETNACESSPCEHGGQCINDRGMFHCQCATGYTGATCNAEIDECQSQPCFFNATCIDQVGDFECVCTPGFEGALCEVETDECLSDPCQNEARCQDQIASFECDCVDEFWGPVCENPPDRCAGQVCLNGATCIQTPWSFQCACSQGFQGARCEMDFDECSSEPCQNGGRCENTFGSYLCACAPGFEGKHCGTNMDECLHHLCAHGSTCLDVINGYQCLCPPGLTGTFCEIDVNECAANNGRGPCQYGCSNSQGSFSCYCQSGFDLAPDKFSCLRAYPECPQPPLSSELDRQQIEATSRKFIRVLEKFQNRPAEIVFLLDSSRSVGRDNFGCEVQFVRHFLKLFSLSPETSRVAVVTYSSCHRIYTYLDYINFPEGKNMCTFLGTDLLQTTYRDGNTCTTGALRRAQYILTGSRPSTPKIVFVLIGSASNEGGSPLEVATNLKAIATIFVITLGSEVSIDELNGIASSSEDHLFLLRHLAGIQRLATFVTGGEKDMASWDRNVPSDLCNTLCTAGRDCCDLHATCSCATRTGSYGCACHPGYEGGGKAGDCTACSHGTYKPEYGNQPCTPCPSLSTTVAEGSVTLSDCQCEEGHIGSPEIGLPCTQVECAGLAIPTYGTVKCQNQETGGRNVYGTVCSLSCDQGYNPIGSRERMCTMTGEWSGEDFSCRAITCPLLPPLGHGNIGPTKCTTKRQPVKSICIFKCNEGFRLEGPPFKRCEVSGNWSHLEAKVACIDDVPPVILCPDSIVKEADPDLSSAEVSWAMPTVSDNLDGTDTLTVDVHPSGMESPHRFEIGVVVMTYTVADTAGRSSECIFKVVILDSQPPTVESCPDETIDITTTTRTTAVSWPEPIFADNSNEELDIIQSHIPGAELTWGTHVITYSATDVAGLSAVCRFTIRLGPSGCPNHPDPVNGARACDQWLFGQFCRVYCNQAYEFAERPAAWYICAQGSWRTQPSEMPVPWPDCSVRSRPQGVRLAMESQYYAGDCVNPKTQRAIKDAFNEDFKTSIFGRSGGCFKENACEVEYVTAYCGDIDEERRRRRRRSAGSGAGEEFSSIVTLEFTVSTLIQAPDDAQHESKFAEAQQSLEEISGEYQRLTQMRKLQLTVNNEILPVVKGSFSASQTVPLCCEGLMLVDNTKCLSCAVGSYLDTESQVCKVCEEGTYQDQEGQDHCKPCGWNEWTDGTGAKDASECLPVCNPGTFSPSGLATCWPCPRGTYQPAFKQTSCLPCREGTTTPAKGSKSFSDCQSRSH